MMQELINNQIKRQQKQQKFDFTGRIRLPTRNEDYQQQESSYFTTQLAESKLKRQILD
jgi:ribosomal protein S10